MFYVGHTTIPGALDEALRDLFTVENKLNGNQVTWDSVMVTEAVNRLAKSEQMDDPNDPLSNLTNAFKRDSETIIKEGFEVLMQKATQYQERYEMPLFAGNMVHKSIEDYIKTGVFRI
jgi:hypothetical protein